MPKKPWSDLSPSEKVEALHQELQRTMEAVNQIGANGDRCSGSLDALKTELACTQARLAQLESQVPNKAAGH
jgi:hypothetical protein